MLVTVMGYRFNWFFFSQMFKAFFMFLSLRSREVFIHRKQNDGRRALPFYQDLFFNYLNFLL